MLTQHENWRIIRIMKKLLNITFCVCILFVSVNFAQKQAVKQTKSKTFVSKKAKNINSAKKKTQTGQQEKPNFVCELPHSVHDVELSQTEIVLNCPASDESCPNNKIIEVKTIAVDSGDGRMNYVYTISAGKIIGEGANVKWDLSDAKPGNYTITAGISQPVWGVLGQTKTKVVIVKECPDCQK